MLVTQSNIIFICITYTCIHTHAHNISVCLGILSQQNYRTLTKQFSLTIALICPWEKLLTLKPHFGSQIVGVFLHTDRFVYFPFDLFAKGENDNAAPQHVCVGRWFAGCRYLVIFSVMKYWSSSSTLKGFTDWLINYLNA